MQISPNIQDNKNNNNKGMFIKTILENIENIILVFWKKKIKNQTCSPYFPCLRTKNSLIQIGPNFSFSFPGRKEKRPSEPLKILEGL